MTQRTISNPGVTTTERFPTLARTRSTFRTPVELVARHLMITKVGGARFTDVRDEIAGIAINMHVWTRVKLAEQAMS
jgi:hypothetical protein